MDSRLSDIELLVLGLISTTPLHGHMINRIIELTPLKGWLHVAEKHVYYVLRKLETAGFASVEVETPPNAPTRKVYAATTAGQDALAAEMVRRDRLEALDATGFTIVFGLLPYTSRLTDQEKTALVRIRRDALTGLRATQYTDESGDFVRANGGEPVWWLWERERSRLDAELVWLDRLIDRVESGGWQMSPPVSLDYVGGSE